MPVLELKDVEVRYGSFVALDGITCSVDGGAVGLLGPNGAGKSTLLKTLLGFRRPSRGEARIFGHSLPREALKVRQRLGYMPEREIMSTKVSAVAFLTYCGRLFGMSRIDAMERAHEVLNYVGMGDNRYRGMETYSTGMLQRVKFAQALVHDPKLLLLDEPTNGLDPDGRLDMLEVIRQLATKRKVTVVLSSHLLPDIEHVCDRVIVIDRGHLLRDGLIADLTTARDGLFELRVRENVTEFVAGLGGAGCSWEERYDGTLMVTAPEGLSPRAFFEIACASGTQIRHFTPVRHRLEEIFVGPEGSGDHARI
ncbi:MAG: ABC transporter ATP-binding protein [FCB group bacterium]|jgi:ABC-2 type transport system ATP-binding protein|nr:ABC transporter ATP-binding protein [FCB group bacterium]